MLSSKVLALERTRTTFEDFMQDDRITVQLPKDTFHVQHFKSVAESLIQAKRRFKICITNDPYERFCVRSYAYTRESAQQRDRTRYTAMVVVFAHYQRGVVGAYEHALVDHWPRHAPFWCANRKINFDDHIEYDSGDESDYNSQGPHFLYFSHGEPL